MTESQDYFKSQAGLITVVLHYGDMTEKQMTSHMEFVKEANAICQPNNNRLSILDVGCGPGLQEPVLANYFQADVLGVTPFDDELTVCLENEKRMKEDVQLPDKHFSFMKSGMPDLKGVNGPFNIIYTDCSFQYIKGDDRGKTLNRFSELLAPGGVIAIRYPDRPTFSPDGEFPSPEEFSQEIEDFNVNFPENGLQIKSLQTAADPLADKRSDKKIRMIQAILTKKPA